MLALVAAVIAIGEAIHLIWLFLSPGGKDYVKSFIKNLFTGTVELAKPILALVEGELQPIVDAFVQAFQSFGPTIATTVRDPVAKVAEGAFRASAGLLTGKGESTPDNSLEVAAAAFADAFGFGISSHAVTAAFEAAFPEKLNTLNGVGPLLAQMAGFEEVAGAVRGPLYDAAFKQSLTYYFRSLFKPELPAEFDAVTWHSRGLLTDDQLRTIFKFSGLKSEYEDAFIRSAYRAVSPFILARAAETGAISNDDLRDVLTFGGYRPTDQERLLAAFNEAAIEPYKKQALSALVTAAERGIVNGTDIDAGLDQLDILPAARPFVKLTIAYRRLEQLDTLYRKSVSEGYQYGSISDQQYIPAMENAGINQDDAAAHYAVDSIKKHGREAMAAERAAARLENQTRAAAIRAAEAEYFAGSINELQLGAAVLATGIDPAIGGFIVTMATARKQARNRWTYGLELPPDKAALLREQVAAIKEQTTKKLITPDQAIAQLASLNIPGPERENLVASWAAQAYKEILPIGQ